MNDFALPPNPSQRIPFAFTSHDQAEREMLYQIGRLLQNWADVEQFVNGQISRLQMHQRVDMIMTLRREGVQLQPSYMTAFDDPAWRWPTRWNQFARQCAHMHLLTDAQNQLNAIKAQLDVLYELRNDFAHSVALVTPGSFTVSLHNHEWLQAKLIKDEKTAAKVWRRFSLEEIRVSADEIMSVLRVLREFVGHIPIDMRQSHEE